MIHWAKLGEHVGCGRRILIDVSSVKSGGSFSHCGLPGGDRFPINLIKGVLP